MKIDTYITNSGMRFKFGFEEQNDPEPRFNLIILEQPAYAGRDESLLPSRRRRQGEKFLIDWNGPTPTLDDAKIVAACWADLTERYISEGVPFPGTQA